MLHNFATRRLKYYGIEFLRYGMRDIVRGLRQNVFDHLERKIERNVFRKFDEDIKQKKASFARENEAPKVRFFPRNKLKISNKKKIIGYMIMLN